MQMRKWLTRWYALLAIVAILVGCGGGAGSGDPLPGDDGGDGETPSSEVADFSVFTDKTAISNNGQDSALLTVVAVDANRNVVEGADVTVNTDQNSVYVPAATTTDASGSVTGQIEIGGDKTDRDVTVTVTVNDLTKRVTVRVSGSNLKLAISPAAPTPGQSVTLTATLLDQGGTPISGQPVTLESSIAELQGQQITTNESGQATLAFNAPSATGVYTVSATGSGTQSPEYQLTVFASAGAVPAAVIPAGVTPSLSASPNVLSVNAVGSTSNASVLRFLMLDQNNNPVQNVRVRFDDQTTGLPAVGASISSDSNTLYTDASGSVTAQYIAGQNSSPTNGVTVRACYKATDFSSTTECPASVPVTLTVAGQALSVSIGDDNLLEKGTGTYIKRFAVSVADSAGRAVADAPVDISVDLTHYGKGAVFRPFVTTVPQGAGSETRASVATALEANGATVALSYEPMISAGERVWCPNEDLNRNGVVDPTTAFGVDSENYNGSTGTDGQATLQPRKADLLISFDSPSVTRTGSNGIVIIRVEYSQRYGTWLAYKIRVTANVSGSQGMAERLFVTDVLEADAENGSFLEPPYGVEECLSAN